MSKTDYPVNTRRLFNACKTSIRSRDVVWTSYSRWKDIVCLQGIPFSSLLTVFPEEHIPLVLFYPIILIVAYPLNDNKPQLLATFEILINDAFVLRRNSLTKAFLKWRQKGLIVKWFIFFSNVTDFRPATSLLKLNSSTGFRKGICWKDKFLKRLFQKIIFEI